jgi:hypothetical protein
MYLDIPKDCKKTRLTRHVWMKEVCHGKEVDAPKKEGYDPRRFVETILQSDVFKQARCYDGPCYL